MTSEIPMLLMLARALLSLCHKDTAYKEPRAPDEMSSTRALCWCLYGIKELQSISNLIPDLERTNLPGVSVSGSHTNTGVCSNQRGLFLPFWSSLHLRDCLEEDEEAAVPEGGQTGEVDGVEDGDLEPGERSSGEKCSTVRVVQEVTETLPASPVPACRQCSPLSLVQLQLGFALIGPFGT